MNRSDPNRLVCLGIISGAHGIRGQVKIRSLTQNPNDITAYGHLRDKGGKVYNITITSQNKETLIASVEGITDRNEAERLCNIELFVERSVLPELKAGQYYQEDLVGIEIFTEDEKLYGRVIALRNFGAGNILEIKRANDEEEFLPFNKKTFPVIDVKNRKIVVLPPEKIG